jgi:hypothetical protein
VGQGPNLPASTTAPAEPTGRAVTGRRGAAFRRVHSSPPPIGCVRPVTRRYARDVAELHRFLVLWGQMGRPGFTGEIVEAWDPEEALVTAADIHPELHRPRVAVPASGAGPFRHDSDHHRS